MCCIIAISLFFFSLFFFFFGAFFSPVGRPVFLFLFLSFFLQLGSTFINFSNESLLVVELFSNVFFSFFFWIFLLRRVQCSRGCQSAYQHQRWHSHNTTIQQISQIQQHKNNHNHTDTVTKLHTKQVTSQSQSVTQSQSHSHTITQSQCHSKMLIDWLIGWRSGKESAYLLNGQFVRESYSGDNSAHHLLTKLVRILNWFRTHYRFCSKYLNFSLFWIFFSNIWRTMNWVWDALQTIFLVLLK